MHMKLVETNFVEMNEGLSNIVIFIRFIVDNDLCTLCYCSLAFVPFAYSR